MVSAQTEETNKAHFITMDQQRATVNKTALLRRMFVVRECWCRPEVIEAGTELDSTFSILPVGFTQYMASLGLGIPLSPVSGQLSPFTEGPELCAIFLCFIWTPVADPRDSSEMTCVVTGIWKS